MNSLRIATWNLEWATTRTSNFSTIEKRLEQVDSDVAVLTEITTGIADRWPYMADGGTHPDICIGNKRKVAIVSKYPITVVDPVGSQDLPSANFLAVDIDTPGGATRVIGVVVRWAHRSLYLDHLPAALAKNMTERTIVAGDYNHRFPDGGPLASRLGSILHAEGLTIHTEGIHPELESERGLIDHIDTTADLSAGRPIVWPRHDPSFRNGTKEVTDHAGSAVDLTW